MQSTILRAVNEDADKYTYPFKASINALLKDEKKYLKSMQTVIIHFLPLIQDDCLGFPSEAVDMLGDIELIIPISIELTSKLEQLLESEHFYDVGKIFLDIVR